MVHQGGVWSTRERCSPPPRPKGGGVSPPPPPPLHDIPHPQVLLESFEESVKTLQELADKNKCRVDKLGHRCYKQEEEHAARIGELEGLYTVSVVILYSLANSSQP